MQPGMEEFQRFTRVNLKTTRKQSGNKSKRALEPIAAHNKWLRKLHANDSQLSTDLIPVTS